MLEGVLGAFRAQVFLQQGHEAVSVDHPRRAAGCARQGWCGGPSRRGRPPTARSLPSPSPRPRHRTIQQRRSAPRPRHDPPDAGHAARHRRASSRAAARDVASHGRKARACGACGWSRSSSALVPFGGRGERDGVGTATGGCRCSCSARRAHSCDFAGALRCPRRVHAEHPACGEGGPDPGGSDCAHAQSERQRRGGACRCQETVGVCQPTRGEGSIQANAHRRGNHERHELGRRNEVDYWGRAIRGAEEPR
mmetsp:Transcript_50500/g.94085  ORF Transcript_50500/g.94085 Transcript_50500/m.94085 type:complete len:252 (-) Transcript_50500:1748-2503(-)